MLAWGRVLHRHVEGVVPTVFRLSGRRWQQGALLVLGLGALLLNLFLIPLANSQVRPILSENYGRFHDIAQADSTSFLIQDFSGINPVVGFAVFGLILVAAWSLRYALIRRQHAIAMAILQEPPLLPGAEVMNENPGTEEIAVRVPCSEELSEEIALLFPDECRIDKRVTIMSVALIILMLEVIIR